MTRVVPTWSFLAALVLAAGVQAAQTRAAGDAKPPPGDEHGSFLEHPAVQRPSVLILLGDDFNWDDLRSVETPHIDALAARGMSFTNHYVFPQCSTTRYSLMFGRYPRRDGIGALVDLRPPSATNPVPTLGLPSIASVWSATWLAPRAALFGKWHLGTNPFYDGDPGPDFGRADYGALSPVLHGFDHYLAGSMANLQPRDYFDWQRVDDGVYSRCTEYAPAAQLAAFRAFWIGAREPRFAVLAPNLAHTPLHRPPDDWLPPRYPDTELRRELFESMVVAFDVFVGRVLAEVDLRDTYVFFLTDNGTPPTHTITRCGRPRPAGCVKGTTLQGGVNVPLIVAGPGIPARSSSTAVVSSADLMATVAELLGVPSPGEDSVSYRSTLQDPGVHVRRFAFSETFDLTPVAHHDSCAVGERYKLRVEDGVEELYDLLLDPREGTPLDRSDPGLQLVLAELRAVLADPLDVRLQL